MSIPVRDSVWSRLADEWRHWRQPHWSIADVAAHWDRTERYDDINRTTYSYFRRFTDGLLLAEMQPAARVLDICARTGQGTLYFHLQGKIRSAVCADVSSKMSEICRRRLVTHGLSNVEWVQITDYGLPFDNGEFDAVLCFETVEHFAQPERLIGELGRVTRPGGSLILTTPNVLWEPVHALAAILGLHHSEGPHRFIGYRHLLRMVDGAGFRVRRAETTVLVPAGPEVLTRVGEWIEARTRRSLMPWLGLRRILICEKT